MLGTIIAVAIGILLIWVLIKLFKHALVFVLNMILGFFALFAAKAFLLPNLIVNFWSSLIVAVGGIIGFIIVVVLHLLHIWF